MTLLATTLLCLVMVATSFLSGLFGMAGGLILIGVLLVMLPLPTAMVLHAVTQIASNIWRALLWRQHVRWSVVGCYVLGCAVAMLAWSTVRYVPNLPIALLMLGVTPFLVRLIPEAWKPDPESPVQGVLYGSACMTLMLLTGVAGPLLDTYFLGGRLARPGARRARDCRVCPRHRAGQALPRSDDGGAISPLGRPTYHGHRHLLRAAWRLPAAGRAVERRRHVIKRNICIYKCPCCS